MNPGLIILILKIAVVAVTILLAGSLIALARGNYRLHGRINLVFFILTLSALLGLEVIVRLLSPGIFEQYLEERQARSMLETHLWFSMPAAALLVVMLFTGWRHHRYVHISLGLLFLVLWIGTFVTGVFYLPH
jgi:uncharacterized membrane protein YozB (DUF420 family)